jgi:hypothetical protein
VPINVSAPVPLPAPALLNNNIRPTSNSTAIKQFTTMGVSGLLPTLGDSIDINKIMNERKELYSNVSAAQKQVTSTRIQNLPNEITDKIRSILSDLKKKSGGGENDSNNNLSDDEIKQFIQYYIDTVHSIIYTPIFYKLTSLNCQHFKDIFSNTQLFTGEYKDNIKTILDNNTLTNNFKILILFMYIDISILKNATYDNNDDNNAINLSDLFITNKNELMYNNYNKNFNCLLGITNEDKNENIIVYISEFINLLSNLLKNDDINVRNEKKLKYNLYEVLLNIIFLHLETIDNIKEQIRIFQLEDNLEFRNKIDNYIKEINDDNIITYLKLRNDQDKENLNNARFNININRGNPTDIMIDYMDDNLPYYNLKNNEYELSDEIINKVKSNEENVYELNKVINKVNIKQYKYHYLIGPFTRIFTPTNSNADIAKQMKTIKDKIIQNKPIFMIGYGASGAGKTSSLIYFNKTKEDGILINLCNEMAREGYTEIQVKCKEFYHTTGIGSVDSPKIVNVPNEKDSSINFVFNNGIFELIEDYTHKTHHQYRLLKPNRQHFEKETVFKQGSKLGEVIIHLIDTDRFVKATTNNPNSSRSHTLVFVKLINNTKNKIGNIIIGDFAGVENKFACEHPNTIKAFLTVKRDNVKDAQGNEFYVPYYSTEAYNGNPDPFGVIETDGQNGGDISPQCIPKIEVKDPIYDFENPVIRKEWKLSDDMIKYYEENDNKNLKMAFNIILEYFKIKGNEIKAEQFKNELELYSSINANRKFSTEQIINNIKIQLNNILKNMSTTAKEGAFYLKELKGLTDKEKQTKVYTIKNKEFIEQLNQEINKKLDTYKISNIPDLTFKHEAFYVKDGSGLSNAYKDDIDKINENIREQYKSVDFLKNIFEKHNLTPDEFTKLNENIFKTYGNFNNLLELVKDLQLETTCRQENSNVICENRREEGYFINDSLEKVREVIKKILYEKNKESINITPNFINICLKNYCPQNSNCFNFDIFNTEKTGSITGSVIFDEIYRELSKQSNTGYAIEQMYKDIIISIFCVFNISKGANNPPPTPYLDINKLKLLFYYEDIVNESTKTNEFITQANKIMQMIDVEFNDKVSGLKTIKSKINDTLIYDSFKNAITAFAAMDNQFKDTYNRLYKSNIKEFIEMIDKNNSVSAIGTMEFLDQIAKFNTVKTLCNSQDTNFIPSELLAEFNKSNLMKPLYE